MSKAAGNMKTFDELLREFGRACWNQGRSFNKKMDWVDKEMERALSLRQKLVDMYNRDALAARAAALNLREMIK